MRLQRTNRASKKSVSEWIFSRQSPLATSWVGAGIVVAVVVVVVVVVLVVLVVVVTTKMLKG
jgi:hypothetical protein